MIQPQSGVRKGAAFVYDARTGESVASYQLAEAPTFVNDVAVSNDAAWFTDSFKPVLYRLPFGPGGALPTQSDAETIPLGGDYVHQPGAFNLDGIDATPDGRTLVVVQSATGELFTVEPATGVARRIDLGEDDVSNGDGILLDGRSLFVVQNVQNVIAVVDGRRTCPPGASSSISPIRPSTCRPPSPSTAGRSTRSMPDSACPTRGPRNTTSCGCSSPDRDGSSVSRGPSQAAGPVLYLPAGPVLVHGQAPSPLHHPPARHP